MAGTVKRILAGSAREFTYTCCGYQVSTGWVAFRSGEETLIHSATFTESATGFYYTTITMPVTPGFYVAEFNAYYGLDYAGDPALWKTRMAVEIVLDEVE